jgi:hypothetical protein
MALVLSLALLVFVCARAGAESLYELAPPGEPLLAMDAHALALGGALQARWDLAPVLPGNPAQLAALQGVSFASALQLRRALRDLPAGSWDETRQDFPGFQFSFPMPGRLWLGAGYRAALRARGALALQVKTPDLDIAGYRLDFTQEGGLNRFPLSIARALGTHLRVGLDLVLLRGSLSQEWRYDFPVTEVDPDLDYQDRRQRRTATWRGTALGLGLQWRVSDGIGASARYEAPATLDGEETRETAGEGDTVTLPIEGESPANWCLGLAWQPGADWHLSAQWDHESWAAADTPLAEATLDDMDRVGLGLEWLWRRERPRPAPERLIPLRLGLRWGRLPRPDPLTGGAVDEQLITLGTGLAIMQGKGAVDLALYRQQLDAQGGEGETRWGLALSLRTSEVWPKRTSPY